MRLREIKEQVQYITIQEQSQRVVINGQIGEIPGQRHTIITCPICGSVLVDLQEEISAYAINAVLNRYVPSKQAFCEHCGQKLDWDIGEIFDGEIIEEINKESSNESMDM